MTKYMVKIEAEIYINVEADDKDGAELLALDAVNIEILNGYSAFLEDKWSSVVNIWEKDRENLN